MNEQTQPSRRRPVWQNPDLIGAIQSGQQPKVSKAPRNPAEQRQAEEAIRAQRQQAQPEGSEDKARQQKQRRKKGDGCLVTLITLIWGSAKIYDVMTPSRRRVVKGFFKIVGLALLALIVFLGFTVYRAFNPPSVTSEPPTPIPSPFWPGGQTMPGSEIPLNGFGEEDTEGEEEIPLDGFQSTIPVPPQQGEVIASAGDTIALRYPGGPGLYDWTWQQLGYSRNDAGNPNGAFVCVYKADIRATGVEAEWKQNPKAPRTIHISQQTIQVCGGVR